MRKHKGRLSGELRDEIQNYEDCKPELVSQEVPVELEEQELQIEQLTNGLELKQNIGEVG